METAFTLQESVHKHLRDAILRLELLPLQHVSEREIADRLGISRTPVKQALSLLRQEGLLEVDGSRGQRVAPIRLAEIDEAYAVREVLEAFSIGLACQFATAAEQAEMEEVVASTPEEPDEVFFDKTQAIHMLIAKASHNSVLSATVGQLLSRIERLRWFDVMNRERRQDSIVDHRLLVRLIGAKDVRAAEAKMRQHIGTARQSVRERLPWTSQAGELSPLSLATPRSGPREGG